MRSGKIAALCAVISGAAAASIAQAALPAAQPGPTVNDYTAAESNRAEGAAQRAGYSNLEITMVQAGNFFLKGEKTGQAFFLTVTPSGDVYSSSPVSSVSG